MADGLTVDPTITPSIEPPEIVETQDVPQPQAFQQQIEFWTKTREDWATAELVVPTVIDKSSIWDAPIKGGMNPLDIVGSTQEVYSRIVTGKSRQERQQTKQLEAAQEAVRSQLERVEMADWFVNFYNRIPVLVQAGYISDIDDYVNTFGAPSLEQFESMGFKNTAAKALEEFIGRDPDIPDWLELDPTKESAVRGFFDTAGHQAIPPEGIQKLTVDAIKRQLVAPRAMLPEGMTDEELLKYLSLMDLPEETIQAAIDIDSVVNIFKKADLEQRQLIQDVKDGIAEWEIPDQSTWDKIFHAVQSPMATFADALDPYIHNVSHPIAGALSWSVAQLVPGIQDIEKEFDAAWDGSSGVGNIWKAHGEAFENWDLDWYMKLPIELLTDPLTYIPGVGLTIPGKLMTRVGMRTWGEGILQLNRGIYAVTDIPFIAAKNFAGAEIWKTPTQLAELATNKFRATFNVSVETAGKSLQHATVEDVAKTLENAVRAFADNPNLDGNVLVDLGRYLSTPMPMEPAQITKWSAQHGGKLSGDISPMAVAEVNDIMTGVLHGTIGKRQGAVQMARVLQVNETSKNLNKLMTEIPQYSKRLATDVDRAIAIGRGSTTNGIGNMFDYLTVRQRAIQKGIQAGRTADGKFLNGVWLGLQRKIDQFTMSKRRMVFDKWMVKPFAEANLASAAYMPWNAFEGISINLLEGVSPKLGKLESYTMITHGLMDDPHFIGGFMTDAEGILGVKSHQRAGAWTMLPGKIPEKLGPIDLPQKIAGKDWLEYSGRKFITASNFIGQGLRLNYIIQKMTQRIGVITHDRHGIDIIKQIDSDVGTPPAISKKSLGLNADELKQEMMRRYIAGGEHILQMKNVVTNGSLMQGEMLKLVRNCELLTPRSQQLAKDKIMRGDVINSPATAYTDISKFVDDIANQSVQELRNYPMEVSDSFRHIADTVEAVEVKSSDDLMELFTHYETMSDTAGFLPHRLMSQTMEESDAIYASGKFGKTTKLWEDARKSMQEIVDEAHTSLARVRTKILNNAGMLSADQRAALEEVLEKSEAGNVLRTNTLLRDGQLLDDFYRLPKVMRTPEEYTALRAYRNELWADYRKQAAIFGAGEMVTRRNLAEIYHRLPSTSMKGVNAEGRALAAQDVAQLFGTNVDGIATGLLDNLAMHGRDYFIQIVKQTADAKPSLFKGFTEDGIGGVYDQLLRQAKINPAMDIASQKILLQGQGLKQQMGNLVANRSLGSSEERALFSWIDSVAAKRSRTIAPKIEKFVHPRSGDDIAEKLGMDLQGTSKMKRAGDDMAHTYHELYDPVTGSTFYAKNWKEASDTLDLVRKSNGMEPLKLADTYKRMYEPADPSAVGKISSDEWQAIKQEALNDANKDYYRAFADYSNEHMLSAVARTIYPYWNYHMYRWFELSRMALRHPGLPVSWGKYEDYSENGFMPTWFPNIEANPFVGSMVGTTFTLTRQDFASYYSQLGPFGEVLDYSMRWGFYPNAPITAALGMLPAFAGRKPELGGILPPPAQTALDILIGTNLPIAGDAAKWLKDNIFHENFHEYYTATILDSMQVDAGGALIEGQTGTDLWFKKLRGEKFTEDEQALWDRAYREASQIGALRAQFPQFRLRTDDYKEAYQKVSEIIEDHLGMSEEFQRDLWKKHLRPTDVVGGLPLDLQRALDEVWEWKTYFGRSNILVPPEVADVKAKIDQYWNKREGYQDDRLATQADVDQGFLTPSVEFHFDGGEWRTQYAANWNDYVSKCDTLEKDPEFEAAVYALTPEGRKELANRLGYSVPPDTPLKEAVNLYYTIELEDKIDPYTGVLEPDFTTFWLKREAVRMALTEGQRSEFDSWITKYRTPMESTFKYAYNTYIRGYKASTRIVFEGRDVEEQKLIREYYADTTTMKRKEEIRKLQGSDGRQIVSGYESEVSDAKGALREVSPMLDFYLYVFGYTTTTKTKAAKDMVAKWEADRSSILVTE